MKTIYVLCDNDAVLSAFTDEASAALEAQLANSRAKAVSRSNNVHNAHYYHIHSCLLEENETGYRTESF